MRVLILTLILKTTIGAIIHGVERRTKIGQGKIRNAFTYGPDRSKSQSTRLNMNFEFTRKQILGDLGENDILNKQVDRLTNLQDEFNWMTPMSTRPIDTGSLPSIDKGLSTRSDPLPGLCFHNPYYHFHSRHFGPSVMANKMELEKYFRFI